ncbi:MAG: hypothetical protein LQ338_006112 [Usnochroma carphineum]|nr:MAG: hypothetical protein LQ338_006112 [Usnochroma carphineum]
MQKSYFLAPTRDCPPQGPIKLGNIITSPSKPEEPINPQPNTPTQPVYETYQTNWTAEVSRRKQGKVGLWTMFLQILGIGADADVDTEKERSDAYKFDRVETHFFMPDKEYVQECMATPEVRDFITRKRFRTNVYMITGIKIAIGASVVSHNMRRRGIHMQVGVDATSLGIPVSLGPVFESSSSSANDVGFEGASDFVFAFRLREIHYAKKKGVSHRAYNKGALFGLEGSQENDEPSEREAVEEIELLGIADEDAGAEKFDLDAENVVDDEGETCQCVVIREPDEEPRRGRSYLNDGG